MEKNTCDQCVNYYQHYILNNRKLVRIFHGHCALHPAKSKRPYNAACEHFSPGTPDEDAFASKEYLSKELLHYMMNLELLPEIENANKTNPER